MCDPVSIGLIVASTAVKMGGQIAAGQAAKQQARIEQGVAEQNVRLTNEQNKDAILNTNIEAQRRYREGSQLQGRQQAAMAANGIDLGFGSAEQVQQDTKMITGEDVGQIYKAGHAKSRGFDIDAFNYKSQAQAAKLKGKAATAEMIFGVASTALGAASQAHGMKAPG